MRRYLTIALWVALVVMVAVAAPSESARATDGDVGAPACFVDDTLYYMVLNLEGREFSLWYGPWELLTCSFTVADSGTSAAFASDWRSPDRPPWQVVKRRGVWSGKPAVSDTVIRVVSEVSKVDPDLIKRVSPDRFCLDLTGGYRLLVLTPDGAKEKRGWAEMWNSFAKRVTSFGRYRELTVIVSPADAQSLYYAMEPGTPVFLAQSPGRD